MIGGPCSCCGVTHQPDDAPRPGDEVLVVDEDGSYDGERGTVQEWSRYGGPLYVRVVMRISENLPPCKLRVLKTKDGR